MLMHAIFFVVLVINHVGSFDMHNLNLLINGSTNFHFFKILISFYYFLSNNIVYLRYHLHTTVEHNSSKQI